MDENYYDTTDFLFDVEGQSKLAREAKKNLGTCENCGRKFEQGYRKDEKGNLVANKYKLCEKCRKEIDSTSVKDSRDVKIQYQPYPWQKRFHASTARFKVISGAARAGKDRATVMEFIDKFVAMLNEDRDYSLVPKVHAWIIAPTYKIGATLIRELMKNFPRQLVVNYDKEMLAVETINNGLIEFRSADDPDSLVSVGLDLVWISEAARIKQFDIAMGNIEDRLDSPGRGPNGSGGLLLVNSSPRGRTHFNRICEFGNKKSPLWRPGWETFYVSRWDAPKYENQRHKYFNKVTNKWDLDEPTTPGERDYEANLKLSRSDRQYNEDILGIPSDEEGSQFPNFRETCVVDRGAIANLKELKEKLNTPNPTHIYRIGYDPAKKVDGAWVCVYDETTGEVVEYQKFMKMNYKMQIEVHLKALVTKWNYATVWYGETGLGEALEPYFIEAGLAYVPKPEQGRNKEKMVENLLTLTKTNRFKIYNINDITEEAILQFEDYGYFITERGSISYHNITSGFHDDAVSASYFAVCEVAEIAEDASYNFYSKNNIFFANNGTRRNNRGVRNGLF